MFRKLLIALLALTSVSVGGAGLVTQSGPRLAPSSAPQILYSTDFEDVTNNASIAGIGNANFVWEVANPSTLSVVGSTDRAVSGTKSIEFAYSAITDTAGDDGQNLEQRFTLTNRYPELWIGFKIWIPTGFDNSDQVGGTSNKKFLAIWAEDIYAGWAACIWEHEPNGSGSSTLTPTYRDETNSSSHGFADSVVFINKTTDAGRWVPLGFHVKQQTTSTTTGSGSTYRGSGTVEVWKDRVLFRSITNFPNWNPDGNGYKYGYLLGAANGGYRVATQFNIDDFVIGTNAAAIAEYLP